MLGVAIVGAGPYSPRKRPCNLTPGEWLRTGRDGRVEALPVGCTGHPAKEASHHQRAGHGAAGVSAGAGRVRETWSRGLRTPLRFASGARAAANPPRLSVDHGGLDVSMTEEVLDGTNVVPVFKEMGGEGMA